MRRTNRTEALAATNSTERQELWVERVLFAVLMIPTIVVCLQLASPSGLPGYAN